MAYFHFSGYSKGSKHQLQITVGSLPTVKGVAFDIATGFSESEVLWSISGVLPQELWDHNLHYYASGRPYIILCTLYESKAFDDLRDKLERTFYEQFDDRMAQYEPNQIDLLQTQWRELDLEERLGLALENVDISKSKDEIASALVNWLELNDLLL